jgi:hypothetical protein
MKLLDRIKAWRRKQAEPPTQADKSDDWKTVGNTFRASDAVYDQYMSTREDDGRPPH